MKKYNPINLYVAAKVKPQEKEVKEGLNQAKKLLERVQRQNRRPPWTHK